MKFYQVDVFTYKRFFGISVITSGKFTPIIEGSPFTDDQMKLEALGKGE